MRTVIQRLRQMLVVCLALTISETVKGSESIKLLPNDPEGLVGQDMHLWCSQSNESQQLESFNFSIVYINMVNHEYFSANDSVVLNRTTAMLTIANLTDAHDGARVFCWGVSKPVFQVIKVGREPSKPNIFYSRYLNWETFVFRWKITPQYNGFHTKYTAWFKSSTDKDFTSCDALKRDQEKLSNCFWQNMHNCTISSKYLNSARRDGFIYLKVNGTNKAGIVTSDIVEKKLHQIVEPEPVKDLKVRIDNGSDKVNYLRPEHKHVLNIKLLLESKENPNENYEWKHVIFPPPRKKIKPEIFNLGVIKPFSEYQLSTRVEYYTSKFPSSWNNITFTSHEEVPSQAPDVCRSCFESERKTLILHFKPLSKEQSRGIASYTMRFASNPAIKMHKPIAIGNESFDSDSNLTSDVSLSEGEFHLNYSKGEALFKLPNMSNTMTYQLEIFANTSSGRGPSTFIKIPAKSEKPLPPTNCSVMTADDKPEEVVFRWNNTDFNQRIETYTIVWCNGSMNRMLCEDPVEWKEVNANESQVSVTLTGGYSGYMFGISATTTEGHSSGIEWSCSFYDKNSVASPPHINPLRIDETVIEVQLAMPHYSPKEGLIYGYNIYYVDVDYETSEEKLVKIYLEERTTRGIAKINRLARGKSYRLTAESLTLAGPSEFRTTRVLATKPFNFNSAEITGLIIALVLLCILAIVGFICCLRYPLKVRRWIKGLQPCTPEVVLEENNNKEQEFPGHPAYCTVVEYHSDHYHLNQQNNEEDDRASCYSEPALSYSGILNAMVISDQLPDSGAAPVNILPPVRTYCAKSNHRSLEIDNSSFPDRFDDSSETESYNATSLTVSADINKQTLVPKPQPNNFSYRSSRGPIPLVDDPEEVDRLLSSVTEQHDFKHSLPATTQNTMNAICPDVHGLDVHFLGSKLSTLPQSELTSVLPSVNINKLTNKSKNESILPKIDTNLVKRTDSNSRVLECSDTSSAKKVSVNDSLETGDKVPSTKMFDIASISSRLSGYSSNSDEASPLSAPFTESMVSRSISNADDDGIYL